MSNTYGNYFCQKLYNISNLEQRIIILKNLKDIFIKVSKDNSGAHVSQFIIGAANSKEEKQIILDYLKNHELELAFDPEGTHVLQKVITCFNEEEKENLFNVLCLPQNLNALCQETKGMCVMKKLISSTNESKNKKMIIEGVFLHCKEIAQSPFGNYIIQNIFEEWDINIYFKLIQECINNAEVFAVQKYSSNIIVKIVDLFSAGYLNINFGVGQFNFIIQLKNVFFNEKKIFDFYNNKYGRLLLIKLSNFLSQDEKNLMFNKINNIRDNIEKDNKIKILMDLFGLIKKND